MVPAFDVWRHLADRQLSDVDQFHRGFLRDGLRVRNVDNIVELRGSLVQRLDTCFERDIGIWNIGAYHRGMMAGRTPHLDKLASQGMLFTDYYIQDLKKGKELGGTTCKVHLDGYNQMDMITGTGPSNRHEIFYFGESALGAVRIDDCNRSSGY